MQGAHGEDNCIYVSKSRRYGGLRDGLEGGAAVSWEIYPPTGLKDACGTCKEKISQRGRTRDLAPILRARDFYPWQPEDAPGYILRWSTAEAAWEYVNIYESRDPRYNHFDNCDGILPSPTSAPDLPYGWQAVQATDSEDRGLYYYENLMGDQQWEVPTQAQACVAVDYVPYDTGDYAEDYGYQSDHLKIRANSIGPSTQPASKIKNAGTSIPKGSATSGKQITGGKQPVGSKETAGKAKPGSCPLVKKGSLNEPIPKGAASEKPLAANAPGPGPMKRKSSTTGSTTGGQKTTNPKQVAKQNRSLIRRGQGTVAV
jgi:hypothetical protein